MAAKKPPVEPGQPGALWDWPNQQVVREDQSGPGVDDGDDKPPKPATKAAAETA
jgi:hypothetical protein